MRTRRGWMGLAGGAALMLAACGAATPAIEVTAAEYRPPLGGSDIGVIYMTVESQQADALTAAYSTAAEGVEIHETVVENGLHRMQLTNRVPLPAGEPVAFKPGGLHLMVIAPQPGDKTAPFPLTLSFESGARQEVLVPLWAGPPG